MLAGRLGVLRPDAVERVFPLLQFYRSRRHPLLRGPSQSSQGLEWLEQKSRTGISLSTKADNSEPLLFH